MEVSILYHSRPLKPSKKKEKKEDEASTTTKKNKLKLWKKVECLRYRTSSASSPTTSDDERAYEGREMTLAAFCRNSSQARLYSLHTRLNKKQKRKKTKLSNISIMSICTTGRWGVVAVDAELAIKVFDLSSPNHPITTQIPFPECLAVKLKKRKELILPPPQYLKVSNDGEVVISQSSNRGTLWVHASHTLNQPKEWKILLGDGGLSTSAECDFVSESAPISVAINRVYCTMNDEQQTIVGLRHQQVGWNVKQNAYACTFASTRTITLAHPVESVIQASTPNRKLNSVAFNFKASSGPVVLFHEPFSQRGILVHLGQVLALKPNVVVCQLVWTRDSLFVAIALSDGSICLLSSAGEPVKLTSPKHKKRPKCQLFFRHLEKYEEKGKVPSHFELASHPFRAELTWCDGNRNLVHVYLPTQALLLCGDVDAVSPFVSAVQTLLSKVSLQGLSLGKGVPLARRLLLAWSLCLRPPVGWTAAERDVTRSCAQNLIRFITDHRYSRNQTGIIQVFAGILSAAEGDFRSAGEVAYVTRTLVTVLIDPDRQLYYAAMHILRMAEAYFHQIPGTPLKHQALVFDVAFDRHWLLLGAQAYRRASSTSLLMDSDVEDEDDDEHNNNMIGCAVLGYAQQRARSWALLRAKLNKHRAGLVEISNHSFPKLAANVWKGHDRFLRGSYDEAEQAYLEDESGSFPAMCLMLRRYRIAEAIAVAESLWLAPNRHRFRSAFGLLGTVMSSVFLSDSSLAQVPSPCCHPTSRTLKFLDLKTVASRGFPLKQWTLRLASQLLLEDGRVELCFRLLMETKPDNIVDLLKLMKGKLARTKLTMKERQDIYVRHMLVLISLNDVQGVKTFINYILQLESFEDDIKRQLLWILLIYLNRVCTNNAEQQLQVYTNYVEKVSTRPDRNSPYVHHPAFILGRLALKLTWDAVYSAPKYAPVIFSNRRSKREGESEWLNLLRAVVLVLCRVSSDFKGLLLSPEALNDFFISRGTSNAVEVRQVLLNHQQNQQDANYQCFKHTIDVVFRLMEVYEQSSDEEEAQEEEVVDDGRKTPELQLEVEGEDDDDVLDTLTPIISTPLISVNMLPASKLRKLEVSTDTPETADDWDWTSSSSSSSEDDNRDKTEISSIASTSSSSSDDQVGVDVYTSPWIFTTKPKEVVVAPKTEQDLVVRQQEKHQNDILEALSKQSEILSDAMTQIDGLKAEQNVGLEKTLRNLEQKVNNLANVLETSVSQKQKHVLEEDGGEDEEEEEVDEEEEDTDYDIGMLEAEEGDVVATSSAVRRFIQFTSRKDGIPSEPPRSRRPTVIRDDDSCFEEEYDAVPAKLLSYPSQFIPKASMPPLLRLHPSTQQSSTIHRYRTAHVVSTNCATQTNVDAVETETMPPPQLDLAIQTSPVSPRAFFAKTATSSLRKPALSSPPARSSPTKRETEGEFVVEEPERLARKGNDYVQMGPLAQVRAKTVTVSKAQLQHGVPAILPSAPPKLYLNLRTDGQTTLHGLTKGQEKLKQYIHVAELDEGSPGVAGMKVTEKETARLQVKGKYMATYQGSVAM